MEWWVGVCENWLEDGGFWRGDQGLLGLSKQMTKSENPLSSSSFLLFTQNVSAAYDHHHHYDDMGYSQDATPAW